MAVSHDVIIDLREHDEGPAGGDDGHRATRVALLARPMPPSAPPAPDLGGPGEPTGDHGSGLLVVPVPDATRHEGVYAQRVKRVLDVVVAVMAIVVALPVLALAALLVRLTMGRPVLFRQERLGLYGEPFEVLKFRTMKPDRRSDHPAKRIWRGEERRCTHKSAAHPLLTPVGRFLRRWSIDELPQLFNVLKGDMSIVGPRPELASVVARYEPWQYGRLLVRPGLTGLWQITARGQQPMHERTDLDIDYVRTLGLATDLRIILATPGAMLGDHKGY